MVGYETATSGTGWKVWSSTSSATDTCDTTWGTWASSTATSAATTTNSNIWIEWNVTGSTTGNGLYSPVQTYRPRELTAEEIEANRVRAERERERAEAVRKEREEAEKRAKELLVAHLDDEQKKEMETGKYFHVIGADGNRYRVECDKRTHNIFEVNEKGEKLKEYCIYQQGECPLPDQMLAQKMMLESDIGTLRRVANQWDYKTRRAIARAA